LTPVVSFAVKACDDIADPSAISGASKFERSLNCCLVGIHGSYGYLAPLYGRRSVMACSPFVAVGLSCTP
ncbi:hypothetical protein, partial [Methylocystis sp. H4A]|uniref:hypothetical protein n=1 Tax=Methylocystis sp. H4A TaxID=2785788 RepID=UPI001AED97E7